jgi:hypothetical protein
MEELELENYELRQRVAELENFIESGTELLEGDSTDDGEEGFDESELPEFEVMENGLLSDAAGYVVGKVRKRRKRKKAEREVGREAVAKYRSSRARKAAEED